MGSDSLESTTKVFGPDTRRESLERLRSNLAELGFEPLPLSLNDLECCWVRLACADKKYVTISWELYEDTLERDDLMKSLKSVCKHKNGDI